MTAARIVIGVDPGPIVGLFRLVISGDRILDRAAVQVTHGAVDEVLVALEEDDPNVLVAAERFVVGRGSMRSAKDGEVTRELVGRLAQHRRVALRTASQVKPWATDVRLAKAGLLDPTKGMRHSRDAARHALYAAVRDGGLPDPLSRGRAS